MTLIALILFVNAALLSLLVPGGPVENRDFTHLTGMTFWSFNLFLIGLGLSSLATSVWLLFGGRGGVPLALGLGGLYLIVYLVDLAGWFPQSPTPMSRALMSFEIVNAYAAILLMMLATRLWFRPDLFC